MIHQRKKLSASFFGSWEMILVYILIVINLVLMISKPNLFFANGTVTSIIQSGLNYCPLVLGMSLVMVLGDVDISCGATMIFCAMCTGMSMDAGIPTAIAVLFGIIAGVVLGAFNGFLVAYMKIPAVIATISTSLLYRGIVKIVLDVNVLRTFPDFYNAVSWRSVAGIPICLILFIAMAAIFAVLLHKTRFGRALYMIGGNKLTSQYSGIDVRKIKMVTFMIMGLICGFRYSVPSQ